MPQMRKLTMAEIATLEYTNPVARAQIAAQYDSLLDPFAVGDYGMAEPASHETLLAVRRRLSAAAARRGWRLTFVSTEGERLVFQVRDAP